MIFHYLDASAWVKRYYLETGTDWVQGLFAQNQIIACASLGFIEVMAALSRKRKAQDIATLQFKQKVPLTHPSPLSSVAGLLRRTGAIFLFFVSVGVKDDCCLITLFQREINREA